ncbi:uncharacterized protein L969DRAFT_45133 [Mixia osmundae IAM 14324]|uniref:Uncharacterized protein n=1 Tax=Mixia osmundae (strain CBS 9802 / IAM 14324 / JCM 22182 / KY 12970) TaxID=764103 RepID=G7DY22_MIXOS|nr:uncharacterized protein L969DRAFT_45133 [Mixia osmundae IAM 14324]KEI41383.1 hypothetical protein L969DRAFT_45133 [Mixia osmundae IAM 14324]GAA95482.1 hypothetical protein E5Q_02136 [Mixia osmundae IAM 14324]
MNRRGRSWARSVSYPGSAPRTKVVTRFFAPFRSLGQRSSVVCSGAASSAEAGTCLTCLPHSILKTTELCGNEPTVVCEQSVHMRLR